MDDFTYQTCAYCKYFVNQCRRFPPTKGQDSVYESTPACGEFVSRFPLQVYKKEDFWTGAYRLQPEQKKTPQPVAESEPTAAELRIILLLEASELHEVFMGRKWGQGFELNKIVGALKRTTAEVTRDVTDSLFFSVKHMKSDPQTKWVFLSEYGHQWLMDYRSKELDKLLADA